MMTKAVTAARQPDAAQSGAGSFSAGPLGFTARAQVKMAKLICRGCPVTVTCLNWALASGQEAGIWGGLTEDERRRLLHQGRRHLRSAANY